MTTMHKNSLKAGLALAALLAAGAASADGKIAGIRAADVFVNSPQAKAADAKMKAEFEKRGNDLQTKGKQLQDDYKNYQRDGDTMAPDARAKVEKDLKTRDVDLGYAQKKLQEDVEARRRDLLQDATGKIKEVIVTVAKEKGYDMVVQDPIYVTPANDITDDVLKRLGSVPAGK